MPEPHEEKQSLEEETAQRIAQFRFSVDLFERNYTELVVFLDYLCAPQVAFSFSWTEERWLLHEGMKEVGFLLHNFVAAAKSLIDHTRVLYRQLYEAAGSVPDYEKEIEERFAKNPLTQFIIKLREMAQHYHLPMAGINVESGEIRDGVSRDTKIQMRLNTQSLRKFDGWNGPAKQYLDEAGDAIDLRSVVEAYFNHVGAFQDWFDEAQRRVHGPVPDLYRRLLLHGNRADGRPEVDELEEGIRRLEGMEREKLTFKDLETAFRPVFNVLDERRLMLCRHDLSKWRRHAMTAVTRRFEIPEALEARIDRLLTMHTAPAAEGPR